MLRKVLIIIAILLLPVVGHAEFPKPTGYVNDFANVVDPLTRQRLDSFLASFDTQTGVEVAVATLPSLDGRPIEDVAVDLFKSWGIGKKGKDNGLLFLVAPTEKKMRFEVGYGLEGAMNDALAGRILDEAVVPRFRAGEMSDGIAAGTIAAVSTIVEKEQLSFNVENALGGLDQGIPPPQKKGGTVPTVFKILFILLMIYLFIRHPWLFLLVLSNVGGGGRGGGGFGGGFGGFGGGLSGGGGASRGW